MKSVTVLLSILLLSQSSYALFGWGEGTSEEVTMPVEAARELPMPIKKYTFEARAVQMTSERTAVNPDGTITLVQPRLKLYDREEGKYSYPTPIIATEASAQGVCALLEMEYVSTFPSLRRTDYHSYEIDAQGNVVDYRGYVDTLSGVTCAERQ